MRGLFRVAADRMEQPYNEWGQSYMLIFRRRLGGALGQILDHFI